MHRLLHHRPQSPNSNSTNSRSIDKPDGLEVLIQKVRIANTKLESIGSGISSIRIAQKRQDDMKTIARKDAGRFLTLTLRDSIRSNLHPDAQKYVEKLGTSLGSIEIPHIDDFKDPANSGFVYSLNSDKKYEILSPVEIKIGNVGKVKAKGYTPDSVLILNAGDSSVVPLVNKVLFDEKSPFQKFYTEQSYGKMKFTEKTYKISVVSNIFVANILYSISDLFDSMSLR